MKCPIVDCEKEIRRGRKICEMHYYRMRRNADYHSMKPRTSRKISFVIVESGCFEVDSHVPYSRGYFMSSINGVRKLLHRHVYEECFGEIPDGLYVCHKCDNKRCINPEHLELGTHEKNVKDAVDRKRYKIGSDHFYSKLKDHEVIEIKKRLIKGEKNIDIAAIFKINKDTISDIKRGKSWKHIVIPDLLEESS